MRAIIKTYGCAYNRADSEKIEKILTEKNIGLTDNEPDAEIIIVNTCGVKRATHNKIINYLKSLNKSDKNVIVTGCLAKIIALEKINQNLRIAKEIKDIKGLVKKQAMGSKAKYQKRIDNKKPAIIQISQGCLNSCTYCATKLARGNLSSKPIKLILQEIRKKIENGYRLIYLTAQDTGCYGLDIKTSLSELLEKILNKFKDENKGKKIAIRIGMANPAYLKNNLETVIRALNSGLFMKFLHVPVQSGSDKILREMGRDYKAKDFIEIAREIRSGVKNVSIATDIIVGYPAETEKDFRDTLKLINLIKPEVVNISKYSKMPGTAAGRMKQLTSQIIKSRSVRLYQLVKSYQNKIGPSK